MHSLQVRLKEAAANNVKLCRRFNDFHTFPHIILFLRKNDCSSQIGGNLIEFCCQTFKRQLSFDYERRVACEPQNSGIENNANQHQHFRDYPPKPKDGGRVA